MGWLGAIVAGVVTVTLPVSVGAIVVVMVAALVLVVGQPPSPGRQSAGPVAADDGGDGHGDGTAGASLGAGGSALTSADYLVPASYNENYTSALTMPAHLPQ